MDNLFEILWRQPNCVKLPTTSWAVHRISNESAYRCITFVNMTVLDSSTSSKELDMTSGPKLPKIDRQVIINENLQTHFNIGNINLDHSNAWPWKSRCASSINNINQIISDFSNLNICIGGLEIDESFRMKNRTQQSINVEHTEKRLTITDPVNMETQNYISGSELSDLNSDSEYDSEGDSEPTVVEVKFIDEMHFNKPKYKALNQDTLHIENKISYVIENGELEHIEKPNNVTYTSLKQNQVETQNASKLITLDKIDNVSQNCKLESDKTDQNKLEVNKEQLDIEMCGNLDDEFECANTIKQNSVSIFKNGDKQIYDSDILDIEKSKLIHTSATNNNNKKKQLRVYTNEEIEEKWKLQRAEYLENFRSHCMEVDSNMGNGTSMQQISDTVPNVNLKHISNINERSLKVKTTNGIHDTVKIQDPVTDNKQNMNQCLKLNTNKIEDSCVRLCSVYQNIKGSSNNCCSVPTCKLSGYRFTRFPKNNKTMFKKWIDQVNNPKLFDMQEERIYKSYRVCLKHFESKWIGDSYTKHYRLLYGAYPTLHLDKRCAEKEEVLADEPDTSNKSWTAHSSITYDHNYAASNTVADEVLAAEPDTSNTSWTAHSSITYDHNYAASNTVADGW